MYICEKKKKKKGESSQIDNIFHYSKGQGRLTCSLPILKTN